MQNTKNISEPRVIEVAPQSSGNPKYTYRAKVWDDDSQVVVHAYDSSGYAVAGSQRIMSKHAFAVSWRVLPTLARRQVYEWQQRFRNDVASGDAYRANDSMAHLEYWLTVVAREAVVTL